MKSKQLSKTAKLIAARKRRRALKVLREARSELDVYVPQVCPRGYVSNNYAHNIVTSILHTVRYGVGYRNGRKYVNKLIDEYDLEELGWNKINI